jgi:hypothetical protein
VQNFLANGEIMVRPSSILALNADTIMDVSTRSNTASPRQEDVVITKGLQ